MTETSWKVNHVRGKKNNIKEKIKEKTPKVMDKCENGSKIARRTELAKHWDTKSSQQLYHCHCGSGSALGLHSVHSTSVFGLNKVFN